MVTQVPFLYINVVALCCYILMFITFVAAKKSAEIWVFMAVLLDCIFWSGGAILMRLQMWPGMNFWYDVSLVALFSMELLFYWFVHTFSRQKERLTLLLCLIGTIAIIPGTVSGYFLAAPTPVLQDDGSTVFTYSMNWHIVIPCILFVATIAATICLFLKLVREKGARFPGLLVIIYGGLVMLVGNLMQIAIPGNTFPYDALAGIGFAVLLMYALYRRRMFRMTLVVSRGLLMIVLVEVCIVSATYLVVPLESFMEGTLHLESGAAMVSVSIIFAGILAGSYTVVNRLTESMFTREEQQGKLINQFSAEVSQTLSSAEIMEKLSDAIMREVPTERIYICLREGDGYVGKYCSSSLASLSFYISADSPQITYLKDQEDYLVVSEFRNNPLYLSVWEAEKELFRKLSIDCVVSLKNGQEVIGLVLLSAKDHSKTYNYVEIGFLGTISSVASIAMKNAGLYEKMFREARIDSLTGVYNYRYFVEQESKQFELCRKDSLSLIFADVDDFKLYNQLYGVAAGDDALKRISEEITRCVGETGIVFRTSGKVFAVLLPHQDTRRANVLAEEIERRIRNINQVPERRHMKLLSVSIGICTAPYAASSAKELMDSADLAAYNAKQSGKNQTVIFRGTTVVPQRLAERTEAVVDRIEREEGGYRSTMSTISALTAAIDAKDHYTFAHSKNVARYAANLAVAAGLNDDQVRTIYAAGLLHDIGKISIPEDILNKTGKLTDEEYGIMKDHVNNSIEMIRHLPGMDYLIPAVLGHHERWDGKGYPRGIQGEEIPVFARCLSIADVFDAMTTDRPYRQGLPLEYALRQIEEGSGTQFDPHLAVIFVQLVRGQEIPLAGQVQK